MEACESGSMFDKLLPDDINVYVTTAADRNESSWGTYCPPHDIVDGKHMRTCLGDLYSVNWMEDDDADGTKETLEEQFQKVKELTNKSHPQEFGTQTFKNTDKVMDYFGNTQINVVQEKSKFEHRAFKEEIPKPFQKRINSRNTSCIPGFGLFNWS